MVWNKYIRRTRNEKMYMYIISVGDLYYTKHSERATYNN